MIMTLVQLTYCVILPLYTGTARKEQLVMSWNQVCMLPISYNRAYITKLIGTSLIKSHTDHAGMFCHADIN